MASSRSREIRLWWPLPLAALVWLLIIWGLGFSCPFPRWKLKRHPGCRELYRFERNRGCEKLAARFSANCPNATAGKPKPVEEVKPAPKLPPLPAPSPPSRSQPKPKAAEKPIKPTPAQPAKDKAITKALPKAAPDAATDLSDYINQAKARRREGL